LRDPLPLMLLSLVVSHREPPNFNTVWRMN
jgi:hypothetical protein